MRTTFFYGGFDGGTEPPVFDQIVDGTRWGIVDTAQDYADGLSSYYEIVVVAATKSLSVCLARNENTKSSPFISALEVQYLEDTLYNSTDFRKFALRTVVRSSFGSDSEFIGYVGKSVRYLLLLSICIYIRYLKCQFLLSNQLT